MRLVLSAVCALSLLLAGCGDDSDDDASAGGAAEETTEQEGEASEGAGDEEATAVALTGAAEVPGPGDEEGTGEAELTLAEGEACVETTVELAVEPQAMHVHDGAETEAGPVVIDFGDKTSDDGWSVCVEADQALLDEIAASPSGFYLNVHNADYPDGAVRGQLG